MTLHRAKVVDILPGGPVVAVHRRLSVPVGPIPTLVAGLAVDDRVVVDDLLDGLADQFVVVGKLA